MDIFSIFNVSLFLFSASEKGFTQCLLYFIFYSIYVGHLALHSISLSSGKTISTSSLFPNLNAGGPSSLRLPNLKAGGVTSSRFPNLKAGGPYPLLLGGAASLLPNLNAGGLESLLPNLKAGGLESLLPNLKGGGPDSLFPNLAGGGPEIESRLKSSIGSSTTVSLFLTSSFLPRRRCGNQLDLVLPIASEVLPGTCGTLNFSKVESWSTSFVSSAESAETIRKRCKTRRKLRKNVTPGIVAVSIVLVAVDLV